MLQRHSTESLAEGIVRSGLIRREDRVLVAVSGGPDSTALLVALHELGVEVIAAHFDHALRSGSEHLAEQVGALCDSLGVRLVTERRTSPMPRGSVQAGARTFRYRFLALTRAGVGAQVVALAHTADDVVEGVVLHLMRGCGLAGLRGMPAKRDFYVRPMLGVWRAEVVQFLGRRAIVAHEDPANANLDFARARVRHQILPALEKDCPGIRRHFYGAARQASVAHEALERAAEDRLRAGEVMSRDLALMPEPVAVELIKLLYARAGGAQPGLSRVHLQTILRVARSASGGKGVDLPGGRRFRIVGHHMQIVAPVGDRSARVLEPQLEVRDCIGCDDPQAAHLRPGLDVRLGFRRPGLRMRPVSGRGSRKLQDILVDARVPREERDSWPMVFAGDRLAWVPGVAVDADLASAAGEAALHVAISPMPDRWPSKVARLEPPISPRGESS
jgi:tRNA(Ile)-lysidine synthetase-like protein